MTCADWIGEAVIDDFAADAARAEDSGARGVDVGVLAVSEPGCGPSVLDRRSSWAVMDDYAELLNAYTAMRALPLPMTSGEPALVAERISGSASRMAAVFLLGLSPADSIKVQALATSQAGPVVVTETDVLAVALAAAAVTMLRRRAVAPGGGRVMVTGADSVPPLEQVLYGAGAGSVATFYQPDASMLPVRRLLVFYDVLIDLTGAVAPAVGPERILSMPRVTSDYAALALPGLLSALCGHGRAVLNLGVLAAAARALALATPADRILPDLSHQLVSAIARHVSRVLVDRPAARSTPTDVTDPANAKGQHP